MKHKPLWKISVVTTPEAEDAVAEMLGSLFKRPAASYFDWETRTSTSTVYAQNPLSREGRKIIRAGLKRIEDCGLQIGAGKISTAKLRRADWSESWKRHFKPIQIRGALLVQPSWRRRRPQKNQAVVVLDPGLSFGTGQHPTTAFCLHEIVRHAKRARLGRNPARRTSGLAAGRSNDRRRASTSASVPSFLDIGTGSGILAIAAAKLGFAPVDAFDADAGAVSIAQANARKNGVADKIHFWRGDVAELPFRPARRYDLICANLISTLLLAERRRLRAQLNARGTLVLAGILKSEFAALEKQFAAIGLKCVTAKTEKEWRSGAFVFVEANPPGAT